MKFLDLHISLIRCAGRSGKSLAILLAVGHSSLVLPGACSNLSAQDTAKPEVAQNQPDQGSHDHQNVGKPQVSSLASDGFRLRDSLTSQQQKIAEQLESEPCMDFEEPTTIERVAAQLTQKGIPTVIDVKALENEGLSEVSDLRFDGDPGSLGQQLSLALKHTGMAISINENSILLTTEADGEDHQQRITFDISPLDMDPEDLLETIHSCVEPLSWECNGGPAGATIKILPVNGKVLLVTRNRSDILFQLRGFLNQLAQLSGTRSETGTSSAMLRYSAQRSTPSEPKPASTQVRGAFGSGGGLFQQSPAPVTSDKQ